MKSGMARKSCLSRPMCKDMLLAQEYLTNYTLRFQRMCRYRERAKQVSDKLNYTLNFIYGIWCCGLPHTQHADCKYWFLILAVEISKTKVKLYILEIWMKLYTMSLRTFRYISHHLPVWYLWMKIWWNSLVFFCCFFLGITAAWPWTIDGGTLRIYCEGQKLGKILQIKEVHTCYLLHTRENSTL